MFSVQLGAGAAPAVVTCTAGALAAVSGALAVMVGAGAAPVRQGRAEPGKDGLEGRWSCGGGGCVLSAAEEEMFPVYVSAAERAQPPSLHDHLPFSFAHASFSFRQSRAASSVPPVPLRVPGPGC